MQFIRIVFLTLLLMTGEQACTSRKQDDSTTESGATQSQTSAPETVPMTSRLTALGLTADSDWRGIHLGDDFSTVATVEQGESFERDKKHVGYTLDLPNLETADVLYYQANRKVTAIAVDLFLNSGQSVNEYRRDLDGYFSARYGASKSGKDGTRWTGTTGTTVLMNDVSKGKDYGLKIKIAEAKSASAL